MGRVNAISIDKSGDTIATAGEDGFVYVQILSENSRILHKYTTAIRVAPSFCHSCVGASPGPLLKGQGVRLRRTEGAADSEQEELVLLPGCGDPRERGPHLHHRLRVPVRGVVQRVRHEGVQHGAGVERDVRAEAGRRAVHERDQAEAVSTAVRYDA